MKFQSKLWQKTEGNEQYDYGYLEGIWDKGKHGKYCACLTKAQFETFLSHVSIYPQSIGTMGSLGCPVPEGGFELGMLPAISFDGEYEDAIVNAYVTPFPEVLNRKHPFDERDFERIKKVILHMYS